MLLNFNTEADPIFQSSVFIQNGAQNLDIGDYSRPFAVDWDNDGVKDLLCGCHNFTAAIGQVWYFHSLGHLSIDTNQLTAAAGGTILFNLDAGASHASRNYLILGSATGTSPGYPLPGGMATLPLNWDASGS
ncbi:MAG: hypothetical protein ABIK28_03120 [Planctomycetota bacterium]